MKNIILIAGQARQGKDTFAISLQKKLTNSSITEITIFLKKSIADLFNISTSLLNKTKDTARIQYIDASGSILSEITPRRLLQKQADFNRQDITVARASEAMLLKNSDHYILTGVRLPSEVDFIKEKYNNYNVIVIKVALASAQTIKETDQEHKTETLVKDIKADHDVNFADIAEMNRQVDYLASIILNVPQAGLVST